MYTRIRGVPRRRDENADAETGIGTPSVPDLGLAVENTAHVDITFNVNTVDSYTGQECLKILFLQVISCFISNL